MLQAQEKRLRLEQKLADRDKNAVEQRKIERERIYEQPCFDIENKDYIKRLDPEHKKFEMRKTAMVARSIPAEDTKPDFNI